VVDWENLMMSEVPDATSPMNEYELKIGTA
jgi:hypothetical protein